MLEIFLTKISQLKLNFLVITVIFIFEREVGIALINNKTVIYRKNGNKDGPAGFFADETLSEKISHLVMLKGINYMREKNT